MKSHFGYWVIVAASALVLVLVGIPLLANMEEGEETMRTSANIPPIDANLPKVTETATFALG